jgi:hypothetical protein
VRAVYILHLYTLTLAYSIVQAFATLGIGIIIGVIYIWKVGLVGLGIYIPSYIRIERTLKLTALA